MRETFQQHTRSRPALDLKSFENPSFFSGKLLYKGADRSLPHATKRADEGRVLAGQHRQAGAACDKSLLKDVNWPLTARPNNCFL